MYTIVTCQVFLLRPDGGLRYEATRGEFTLQILFPKPSPGQCVKTLCGRGALKNGTAPSLLVFVLAGEVSGDAPCRSSV